MKRSMLLVLVAAVLTGCDLNQQPPAATGFVAVSAGREHTCAIRAAGSTVCWGANDFGQLGQGTSGPPATEPRAVIGTQAFARVMAGDDRSCALESDGQLFCWGAVPWAPGAVPDDNSVPAVLPSSLRFSTAATGFERLCAIDRTGTVWCLGAALDTVLPLRMHDSLRMVTMSVGDGVCGITAAGDAWCSSTGNADILGSPSVGSPQEGFHQVSGGLKWKRVAVGVHHACGITTTDALYCWGTNTSGQLGTPLATAQSFLPVEVTGAPILRELSLGDHFTCGLTSAGQAWCWGSHAAGQLGADAGELCGLTQVCRSLPAPVETTLRFVEIDAGFLHVCGRTATHEVWCWGANTRGQLGDGTLTGRSRPVRVNDL